MRKPTLNLTVVLAISLALAFLPASAQETDSTAAWLALVNEARLDAGLAPYSLSTRLSAAAQRHADDVAAHGFDSANPHRGSDGTLEDERIAEAGYAAWTRGSGNMIVDENIWSGDVETGFAFFMDDATHRRNLLSSTYREIGIGAATSEAGRDYYVLDFGARPRVLPIFINEGAASTDNPQVAILLTNEDARPEGEGTDQMGRAIEIRIRDELDMEDLPWQPWERLVAWTLPDTPGEHTVYVQFRDAAGRTTTSADAIFLGDGTPTTSTPVPPSATPEPSDTPTPEPSATPEPTATATVTDPTSPPSPTAAPTQAPSETPISTPSSHAPTPLPPIPATTPFPTWTPLPTSQPAKASTSNPPSLITLVALQGAAVLLGIYLLLHRRQGK